MHYLRNNLGNLNHIIRFTSDEDYLKVFRILRYFYYLTLVINFIKENRSHIFTVPKFNIRLVI